MNQQQDISRIQRFDQENTCINGFYQNCQNKFHTQNVYQWQRDNQIIKNSVNTQAGSIGTVYQSQNDTKINQIKSKIQSMNKHTKLIYKNRNTFANVKQKAKKQFVLNQKVKQALRNITNRIKNQINNTINKHKIVTNINNNKKSIQTTTLNNISNQFEHSSSAQQLQMIDQQNQNSLNNYSSQLHLASSHDIKNNQQILQNQTKTDHIKQQKNNLSKIKQKNNQSCKRQQKAFQQQSSEDVVNPIQSSLFDSINPNGIEYEQKSIQNFYDNIEQKSNHKPPRAIDHMLLYSRKKQLPDLIPIYQERILTNKKQFLNLTIQRCVDNDVSSDEQQIQMGVGYMYFQLLQSCQKQNQISHQNKLNQSNIHGNKNQQSHNKSQYKSINTHKTKLLQSKKQIPLQKVKQKLVFK